jgi:MFS family permease
VAEHAPDGKRGLYTAFIQTTATLGLFLSLLVILACRLSLGTEAFEAWGWRIPFLASIILLGISVWIRLQLSESPLFQQMKAEGKGSKTPFRDSLKGGNLKLMLLVLFGATAGQAVVWYAGQFYALFYLQSILKVDSTVAYLLIAAALFLATPFFLFFGWLSDRIGRKKIIMAGCLLAAVTYFPDLQGHHPFRQSGRGRSQPQCAGRGGRGQGHLLLPVRPDPGHPQVHQLVRPGHRGARPCRRAVQRGIRPGGLAGAGARG